MSHPFRMSSIFKRVEFLANIAIIIVGLLLGFVLIKNHLFQSSTLNNTIAGKKNQAQSGTQISIPGIDWTKSNRTLLLVLSSTCHYCTESAPFYQRLVKESAEKNVRLIAVLPQQVDVGREYLKGLGVSVNDVIQAPLDSTGVTGTPTLILIDNNGEVVNWWVGKLPTDQEVKVLNTMLR